MSKKMQNNSNQFLLLDFKKTAECLLKAGQYEALIHICNQMEDISYLINNYNNSDLIGAPYIKLRKT
ncbi:MAG: hypothetical protein SFT68_03110 [Rickettsiaceae bacterium]|nr:hypothetical protein [Rickettsiaceae bacterium]